MKKNFSRILCVLLLCIMILTSCGETMVDEAKDYINNHSLTPAKPYVTLNLYLPTDKVIEASTVSSMQIEFNSIIESLYRTRVIFHFVKDSDYVTTVNNQLAAAKNAKTNNITEDTTSTTIGDNYPKEASYQMDMFVCTSKAWMDSLKGESLVDLTTYMTSTYNRNLCNLSVTDTISNLIYDNACYESTVDEVTTKTYYGVPSNFLIGEYTYYIIDKAWADSVYFDLDTSKSVATRMAYLKGLTDYSTYVTETTGNYTYRDTIDKTQYYVEIKSNPVLEQSEIFNSMFCISSYCANVDRAMEVIVALFTNKTLHTTLQYGAKNVTYRYTTDLSGDTCVELISGAPVYSINAKYTGNILQLYPCTTGTYTKEYFSFIYKQNSDATINK